MELGCPLWSLLVNRRDLLILIPRFGTNILSLVYSDFRLPETKGRSYGELDVLFFKKVPARKFKTTAVDGESQAMLDTDFQSLIMSRPGPWLMVMWRTPRSRRKLRTESSKPQADVGYL